MHHGIKKLLLLGAGHAHVHVLAQLARHRPADLDVILLTPFDHHICSGMAPGFVAGHYGESDCQIALAPLVRAAGARWVQGRCAGLDAGSRQVTVAAHGAARGAPDVQAYDLLSIDTGATTDRARLEADMPGAATHALNLRPIEGFARLWPQVLALAQSRPVSLAMIGACADGIELLFAAEQAIRHHALPGSRFTLVTGGPEVVPGHGEGARRRVLRQLKRRGITVLREACTGIGEGVVHLGNGATLACDAPLLASAGHAPAWLQGSGLALSGQGKVEINAFQQSTSHPEVFAVGGVAERADTPHAQGGVHAGAPLLANLLAAHEGQPLRPCTPPGRTLDLLSCGTGHAIASYGPLHAEGGWAWAWKDRIGRRFVASHNLPT